MTFQEKGHERNLGRFHFLEGFPIGFVVQRGILETQMETLNNIKRGAFLSKCVHVSAHLLSLTVMSSSSEKSFLNFPGHFWGSWEKGGGRERDLVRGFVFFKLAIDSRRRAHTYLPGLVESADSRRVETHDDGECRVQISLSFTTMDKTYFITAHPAKTPGVFVLS